MDLDEKLARLEQRLKALIYQRSSTGIYFSSAASTTSDGQADTVDGLPSDGDDTGQRQVHRYQHAGFRSRPPKGTAIIALALDGSASKLAAIAEDDQANVTLDDGEAALYCPAVVDSKVWLDKDGAIHIQTHAGSSAVFDKNGKVTIIDAGNAVAQLDGSGNASVTVGGGKSIKLNGDGVTATLASGALDVT